MSTVWKGVAVSYCTALVLVTCIAVGGGALGMSVTSPSWAVLGPMVMWTPALGVLVARKTVDRDWAPRYRLRTWGKPWWWVLAIPVLVSLGIYGMARMGAVAAGHSTWDPHWDGAGGIVVNLVVNFVLIAFIGGFGSLGEELGWRGYLQPRLEDAGVRFPVLWVAVLWAPFHLPVMLFSGYLDAGDPSKLALVFTLFFVTCVADSYLWARACTYAKSLWPAVWFHTYHNWFSQFVFPRLFSGDDNELMIGEHGVFAMGAHVLFASALFVCLRRKR